MRPHIDQVASAVNSTCMFSIISILNDANLFITSGNDINTVYGQLLSRNIINRMLFIKTAASVNLCDAYGLCYSVFLND